MSAALIISDRRNVSPARLRVKLKAAGLDPNLARALPPKIPAARKIDFRSFARITSQRVWTNMLVRMVSGDPR